MREDERAKQARAGSGGEGKARQGTFRVISGCD